MHTEENGTGRARKLVRRIWRAEDRARIVAETLEPGASVSVVARRHDVNTNLLFRWRKTLIDQSMSVSRDKLALAHADQLDLVPAMIVPDPRPAHTAVPPSEGCVSGRIQITLTSGDRLTVWSDVDEPALSRVMKALSQR